MMYTGSGITINLYMRTYFIIACIFCGTVASAADYAYDVNVSDNGGAFAVADGENKVVSEDSTYDNMYAADPYLGGAIYVGENASLELQGTHIFTENAHLATEKGTSGIWLGDYNDVYLASGAKLILNTQDADDIISLGSGLSSAMDGGTTVIKKGEGKLIVGSMLADFTTMYTDFQVEEGTAEMQSSINTTSIRVAEDASVFIDPANLIPEFPVGLLVGTTQMEAISISANGSDVMQLRGLEVSADGVSSVGAAQGSVSGASIAFEVNVDTQMSLDNISFTGSNVWVDPGYGITDESLTLSNISLDASSAIWATATTVMLGDNYVELDDLSSSQLSGVTLGDGATLTLKVSDALLSGEAPESFSIILEDLALAEGADVTFDVQMTDGSNFSYVVSGYQAGVEGLKLAMSAAAVPEPATATLSLLALAALAARRRRVA